MLRNRGATLVSEICAEVNPIAEIQGNIGASEPR